MNTATRHALSCAAMHDAQHLMRMREHDHTNSGARACEVIEARIIETARCLILADSLGSLATATLEPR